MSVQHIFRKSQRQYVSEPSRINTDPSSQKNEDNVFDPNVSNDRPKKSPWELYNERASIYDRETLKEWEDTLSILLVFVSYAKPPMWNY
jgi:hypothetical protein